MRGLLFAAVTVTGLAGLVAPALADSCYDLWYERNQIYNQKGFCFQTQLGQQVFDNSDCYTRNPRLSRWEQRRVDAIKREEWARGCKVNN